MIYRQFQNKKLSALGFGCMRLPEKDGQVDVAQVEEMTGLKPVLWDERRTTVDAHRILFEAGKNAVQAHLNRKGLTQGKMEFGVAIVRNRAIYEIKEKKARKL